jgi:hypothetical protein
MRVLAVALVLAAPALAAPVPKGKEAALYFPTAVGAKRVLALTSGGKPQEFTETVMRVEEKGGVYTVTVEYQKSGAESSTEDVYEVSAKGVFRKSSGGAETKDPVPLLKLGGKPGDTWEAELTPTAVRMKYTLGKEEEVVVPAGKYQAVRVEAESGQNGLTRKTTTWYAAGVGAVKLQVELGGRTVTQELKALTPGGDKKK